MLVPSLLLMISVVILYYGAEFSLESSEKIGKKIGLSPLMIGMLLIGFGTSLPELFVGHIAGSQGKTSMAVGSLIGSNIANMFLILGVSGFMVKMNLTHKDIRHQLLLHLLLGFTLFFVLTRERLDLLTSTPLIFLCGIYLYFLFKDFKNEDNKDKNAEGKMSPLEFIKLIGGFGALFLGGELLVKSASDLGFALGISDYIISAILIAFGTSFPELVTSLLAAYKKKDTDMIVGNIIGSNLFNCAFILGSLGVYDFPLNDASRVELISLILGAGVLVMLSFAEKKFYRKSATLFVISYACIIAFWLKVF